MTEETFPKVSRKRDNRSSVPDMPKDLTLSEVIQEALAEHGVTSLREAEAATGLDKDVLSRRYRGLVAWSYPDDLEPIAKFLGVSASELVARAEKRSAA